MTGAAGATTNHDAWNDARDHAVWSGFGLATLAATNWLGAEPGEVDGLPGRWHAEGGRVIGTDISGEGRVVLAPDEEFGLEGVLLRGFERDGSLALRVYDRAAPARRGISGIERHPYDPSLRVVGRFEADGGLRSETVSVDDHRADAEFAGRVHLELDGRPLALDVARTDDTRAADGRIEEGLFAAFSDGTGRQEGYPFRFLRMPAPAADATLVVDLNRAYLPPCAFSDHYVCVLPTPQNRWTIDVRGGERAVR
ncbi:DUF1684 domain-containing protein [Agromyces sp. Leaf222]|uniref:DUF1684 domain-containing protein n=1 Tax=Agromyces sp. Leaf222 TaxID=1735688 RepID=UPI0006F8BD5E|nr:DUF1684 domain-containing protein [Agromyces sp. Leaf222]KQM81483.1 hypothetical protein ASE68_17185 [Agromyces sp. Leaf222]